MKADGHGLSILDFLCERFPFRSKHAWKARIENGRIERNGHPGTETDILAQGDEIRHFNPHVTEPSVPDGVKVLSETDSYLLVFKPAPMPVHPGGRYYRNTLTAILDESGYSGLHVLHRLDSVTSGLMLIGKTPEFSREAGRLFTEGRVHKTYYALAEGCPEQETFSCDRPVLRDRGFRFRCDDAGKSALTHFRVIEKGHERSLIECKPVTGRTHQIRLHLAHAGLPVTGDLVYQPGFEQALQHSAIFLQSSGLRIPELGIDASLAVPSLWKSYLLPDS